MDIYGRCIVFIYGYSNSILQIVIYIYICTIYGNVYYIYRIVQHQGLYNCSNCRCNHSAQHAYTWIYAYIYVYIYTL